jgi:hypothetical protein
LRVPAHICAHSLGGVATATGANTSNAATIENATLNLATMVNP